MFQCGEFRLSLDRPLVMGIVNLTPDSFSGDGLAGETDRAIAHARAQIEAGADLIDLGAESSRPGAQPASLQEELDRLGPILTALRGCGVPISVDTYKPEAMRFALMHGASMINDIFALRMPGAVEAVQASNCGLCLMHMQGEPLTMQASPSYGDVVEEVGRFLIERADSICAAGIAAERLVLDPGFGFGKTLEHNLELLRRLGKLTMTGFPVLVGMSRKSMLGAVTGRPVGDRLAGSLGAAMIAIQRGAKIVRVHDVAATRDVLALIEAVDGFDS